MCCQNFNKRLPLKDTLPPVSAALDNSGVRDSLHINIAALVGEIADAINKGTIHWELVGPTEMDEKCGSENVQLC